MQQAHDPNDGETPESATNVESMASREPVNILILGGSFAGISVAHHFLRKTIHSLGTTRTAPKYRVLLVSPSTHFYWNVGAPRAICSSKLVPENDAFLPIPEAFQGYPNAQFRFVHGLAVSVNFPRREVNIQLLEDDGTELETLPFSYHALVIATGCSEDSELLSLHGDHSKTVHALHEFQLGLETAASVVIVGGGPSGVECAGQLATWVDREQNRRVDPTAMEMGARKTVMISPTEALLSPTFDEPPPTDSQAPIKITLISGHPRLLPKLPAEVGYRAERQLKSLGVNIMHNIRLITTQRQRHKVHCILSNDMTLETDLFIGATGVRPNTSFLPHEFLDASGYVASDPRFCRLGRAGDRVYAIGSVTANSQSLADVWRVLPVLMQNMRNDIVAYEIKTQHPFGGGEDAIKRLKDSSIDERTAKDVSILCPITRWGGAGVVKGHSVPAVAVWALKGKDYGFKMAKKVVTLGTNPFPA